MHHIFYMDAHIPTDPTPRILLGTDFSATADAALDWAVELAAQRHARLEMVHAVALPPILPELTPPTDPDFFNRLQSAARQRLDVAAEAVRGRLPEIDTFQATGSASKVLLERAEEIGAQLIVLGTKGHTGLAHILLGSTAERVVQRAHCPVLCVHPGDKGGHRPIRSILVPTDFSEDAELAIATAHEILAPLESGAKLILVHAFSLPIEYTAYGPIPTSIDYLKDAGLEAERKLFEMEEQFRRDGLAVETVAREGDPLVVICDIAREQAVDLIAIGTHGKTGIRHLLLGSTAERVMHQAPCPVLTIRRQD